MRGKYCRRKGNFILHLASGPSGTTARASSSDCAKSELTVPCYPSAATVYCLPCLLFLLLHALPMLNCVCRSPFCPPRGESCVFAWIGWRRSPMASCLVALHCAALFAFVCTAARALSGLIHSTVHTVAPQTNTLILAFPSHRHRPGQSFGAPAYPASFRPLPLLDGLKHHSFSLHPSPQTLCLSRQQ